MIFDGVMLKVLVGAALLLFAAWACVVIGPALGRMLRETFGKWMGLDPLGKAVTLVCVCFLAMYGGSKSIMSKTSHDPEIGLAAAEYVRGTNGVPASLVSSLGAGTNMVAYAFSVTNSVLTGSELAEKVWFREDNRNAWTNFTAAGISMQTASETHSPTTTVWFAFATNDWQHQQIYVGDDLPPVYIETEGGVTLDSLVMTSKKATITYTVDASALTASGQVLFERMWLGGEWQTVRAVTAVAGQHVEEFPGFFVMKRSMWRIRLLVEVSN